MRTRQSKAPNAGTQAGVRLGADKLSVDLGLIWMMNNTIPAIPVPWIDVTYNFGT